MVLFDMINPKKSRDYIFQNPGIPGSRWSLMLILILMLMLMLMLMLFKVTPNQRFSGTLTELGSLLETGTTIRLANKKNYQVNANYKW